MDGTPLRRSVEMADTVLRTVPTHRSKERPDQGRGGDAGVLVRLYLLVGVQIFVQAFVYHCYINYMFHYRTYFTIYKNC